jgi:hypothetical protein
MSISETIKKGRRISLFSLSQIRKVYDQFYSIPTRKKSNKKRGGFALIPLLLTNKKEL